jgi:hypothetical protein
MQKTFSIPVKKINIEEINNSDFLKLEMYAITEGQNRNDSDFTLESMQEALPTFRNKPILGFYNIKTKNLEEHNSDVGYDFSKDELYYDYTGADSEKPIGLISESDIVEIRKYEGNNWIYFTSAIWTKYNKQIVDLLKQNKRKKVSVEITILDSYINENNIEVIKSFIFDGVTILGNQRGSIMPVQEGIAGAHTKLLEFAQSEKFNQYKHALCFAYNKNFEEGGKKVVFNGLSMNQLCNRLNIALSAYTYGNGEYEWNKYWIDDVTDTLVIVHDCEDGKLYTIPYSLIDNEITLDINSKQEVEIDYKPVTFSKKQEVFLSKDKWGSEEEIMVNKSKKAMSTDAWGSVNKTSLRNKILSAKNYKSLVNDVYGLVEDGWEDSPSSKLKYPLMGIKDEELVFFEGALSSALSFAKANDETEVINKVKKIRKQLGLDKDSKKEVQSLDKDKFSKNDYTCFNIDDKYAYLFKAGKVFAHAIFNKDGSEAEFSDDMMMPMSLKVEITDCEDETEVAVDDVMAHYIKSVEDDKAEMAHKVEEAEKAKDDAIKEKDAAIEKKESMAAEKDEMVKKVQEKEEEIKKEKMSKFNESVEFALADEDEDTKNEMKKQMSEKEYSDIEDFKKDLAYIKYKKDEEIRMAKKNEFKVNINNNKIKTDKSIYEDIQDSVKNVK